MSRKKEEKLTSVGEKTGESHALGTHLKGEHFDRVESLHGRPAGRVAGLEDEDKNEDSSANGRRHLGLGGVFDAVAF